MPGWVFALAILATIARFIHGALKRGREQQERTELTRLGLTGRSQRSRQLICGRCGAELESLSLTTCPACESDLRRFGIADGCKEEADTIDTSGGVAAGMGMVFGMLFSLMGAAMLCYVIWIGAQLIDVRARYLPVDASVVEVRRGDGRTKVMVRYNFGGAELTSDQTSVDGGIAYQTEHGRERALARFPVDGPVTAYVDPRHPERAVITRDPGSDFWQSLAGVFAPAFLSAGRLAWVLGRRAGADRKDEFLRRCVERSGATTRVFADLSRAGGGWLDWCARRAVIAPAGMLLLVFIGFAAAAANDVRFPPILVLATVILEAGLIHAIGSVSRFAMRQPPSIITLDPGAGTLTLGAFIGEQQRVIRIADIRRFRCTDSVGRDCIRQGEVSPMATRVICVVGENEEQVELGSWMPGTKLAAAAARWFAQELGCDLTGDVARGDVARVEMARGQA